MAAYVIVDMSVTDAVRIEDYRRLAGVSIAAHGGKFLVRGGNLEVLDGDWKPQRVVVIAFPGMEQARRWRACADYGKACEIRNQAAQTRMILVEGVA